jgi:hypothetical protein
MKEVREVTAWWVVMIAVSTSNLYVLERSSCSLTLLCVTSLDNLGCPVGGRKIDAGGYGWL